MLEILILILIGIVTLPFKLASDSINGGRRRSRYRGHSGRRRKRW